MWVAAVVMVNVALGGGGGAEGSYAGAARWAAYSRAAVAILVASFIAISLIFSSLMDPSKALW
jgi:hypothetical protein